MVRLVLARIPQMIAVILGVTFISFCLVNVLPGNIVATILGGNYTAQSAAQLTKELGLNHPLVWRYLEWLGNAIQGKFGSSLITHIPVARLMWQNALPTVELVVGGELVALLLGVLVAFASVASRRPIFDRLGTGIGLLCSSIPSFVLALLLIALLGVHWHLISTIGWRPPSLGWGTNLNAIALPCILLGLGVFPGHMRIFRSELDEQLSSEEYVTLARMKGVSTRRLMLRHVARNSAFGLITVSAVSVGFLVGGAVVIEDIFAIPGFGTLIYTAVQNRDSPVVVGCITVVAAIVVVLNLLADLAYAILDPRVRDAI